MSIFTKDHFEKENPYEIADAKARATIRELEKRLGELEAERDDALREHTDMVWQRRRAEEQADYATHLLKLTQDRLTAERQRREEVEKALAILRESTVLPI